MLIINNIVKLKGRTVVLSLSEGWTIIEVGVDHSPATGGARYIIKLSSMSTGMVREIAFVLYRVFNIKEKGYRMYNNKTMDYITVTKGGLKDMRTFMDIVKDELNSICSQ